MKRFLVAALVAPAALGVSGAALATPPAPVTIEVQSIFANGFGTFTTSGAGPCSEWNDDRPGVRLGLPERQSHSVPRSEDVHMQRRIGDVHGEPSGVSAIRRTGQHVYLEHPERHRRLREPARQRN